MVNDGESTFTTCKAETALQMDKCVEALLNIQPHVSVYCRAMGVSLINLVNLIKIGETAGTIKLQSVIYLEKPLSHTINKRHETLLQSCCTPKNIFSLGHH